MSAETLSATFEKLTVSLDASMIACRIPAGWYRDFAFTRWPAFRPRRWDHLRRTCSNAMRAAAPAPILAFDLDPAACRRLQAALERVGLSASVAAGCRDFFDIDPRTMELSPGVALINPPYGRRLGTASRSHDLFARICDHLARCYPGWTVALIAPPGADGPVPAHLAPARLVHGGLHLVLHTGVIGR
ncbi:MAG: hypothetical protein EOM10_14225 [Opitutae bacterium]|nr:hypothetical protein [Opitutae bacterium]